MPAPNPQQITVDLPQSQGYTIHFAPLAEAARLFAGIGLQRGQALVITDENVAEHYLQQLTDVLERDGWMPRTHIIPAGELSKSASMLGRLYDRALEKPIDRDVPVVALGGGMVGDLAGFFAATLLRGLPLVHIPTSVIAQADSSIGGKSGINHSTGKNLIGAFYQPRLVLTDVSTLATLPERDYTSGLAEVVKHALIADAEFFGWLESRWGEILGKEESVVAEMIFRAASIKAAIVNEDERESGRRRLLNFGHSFGHAIELASGYGLLTHGEAIAIGMRAALHLSSSVLSKSVFQADAILHAFERADALISRIPGACALDGLSINALVAAMATDKKRTREGPRFVVLSAVGKAVVVDAVPPAAVEAAWGYALTVSRAR